MYLWKYCSYLFRVFFQKITKVINTIKERLCGRSMFHLSQCNTCSLKPTEEPFMRLYDLEIEMIESINENWSDIVKNSEYQELIAEYATSICPVYYHEILSVALSNHSIATTESEWGLDCPMSGIKANIEAHLITFGLEFVQWKFNKCVL